MVPPVIVRPVTFSALTPIDPARRPVRVWPANTRLTLLAVTVIADARAGQVADEHIGAGQIGGERAVLDQRGCRGRSTSSRQRPAQQPQGQGGRPSRQLPCHLVPSPVATGDGAPRLGRGQSGGAARPHVLACRRKARRSFLSKAGMSVSPVRFHRLGG